MWKIHQLDLEIYSKILKNSILYITLLVDKSQFSVNYNTTIAEQEYSLFGLITALKFI